MRPSAVWSVVAVAATAAAGIEIGSKLAVASSAISSYQDSDDWSPNCDDSRKKTPKELLKRN